jgi:KaiC/GvpD/RAD55 family RecA-like ATPase
MKKNKKREAVQIQPGTDLNKSSGGSNLFAVKSANAWIDSAKQRAEPVQLFKELWYAEEVCILFADTNVGKSIFAVQIANEIAKDQSVIYFDFELSDKQFEARYSNNYADHYVFPDNFFRAEIDPDADFEGFESFEDYLIDSIEKVVMETEIKILVIDNITYLKNETDKAKNALPLMKQLKAIKRKYGLSILVLAHTPKRDLSKPITQNDLQGSKMLINFCDSAFAIGASQADSAVRYVKQIKQRNTEQVYHSDNVLVYQIEKPENFLFMAFTGYGHEREHLKLITEKDIERIKDKVKDMYSKGMSQRQIAYDLCISVGAVNKYVHLNTMDSVNDDFL